MAGPLAIKRKLLALKQALPAIAEDSVEQTKQTVIQLNREQMLRGQDASGNLIGKYKSDPYALKKFALSSLAGFGNKDYRLTGEYYRGFFAATDAGKLILGSIDPKARFLDRPGLFGLTNESRQKYKPVLTHAFVSLSKNKIKSS